MKRRLDRSVTAGWRLGIAGALWLAALGASTVHAQSDEGGCGSPFIGEAYRAASDGNTSERSAWEGVAVSRVAHGVIAAWRSDAVYVSRDDGEHFSLLASVPETRDVAVGARGTVFVLTGRELQSYFRDGRAPRVVELPWGASHVAHAIGVGHGYVAVAAVDEDDGDVRLALSNDYGATWRVTRPAPADFPRSVSIDDAGVVRLRATVYNCHSGDYDIYAHIALDGHHWRSRPNGVVAIGPDTVLHWDVDRGGQLRVVASGTEESLPLPLVEPRSAHNDRVTYLMYPSGSYQLREGTLSVAAVEPLELQAMVVDRCDRIVGIAAGSLVRWSASAGWRRLVVE